MVQSQSENCVNNSMHHPALVKFQTEFIQNGRQTGVPEPNSSESGHNRPAWLDPDLIETGQSFIRTYFFSIFSAHLISLIFLLCYLPVRLTLLRTGRSDTKFKALKRYLDTLIHIKGWYEGDLVGSDCDCPPAVRDIQRIRRLHYRLSRSFSSKPEYRKSSLEECDNSELVDAVRADLKGISLQRPAVLPTVTSDPAPVISQLDMAVTQFCFMGFLSMYPSAFGIHQERKGLDGFIHVWALIGHHLGIQDEYNLCLDQNFQTRQLVLPQILLPNFGDLDPNTVQLWSSLASGIGTIVPGISLRAILLYTMRRLLKAQATQTQALLNSYDAFCYKLMNLCFDSWISKSLLRSCLNGLLRLAVFLTALRLAPPPASTPAQPKISINNNNEVKPQTLNSLV